jgi:hypothetical protein
MSAISVEHPGRWWGSIREVDDVSFEAAAGTMVAGSHRGGPRSRRPS